MKIFRVGSLIVAFTFCTLTLCPFFMSFASAYPNLAGTWQGVNPGLNRQGAASIQQNGSDLLFISETGTQSKGYFLPNSANVVVASDWGNLQGTLTNDATRINWANNTYWVRTGSSSGSSSIIILPNLSGAWQGVNPGLNRQGAASIQQNGSDLLFISETGTQSKGYFLPNSTNVVVASDWGNLQGTLTNGATRINWENNTYWVRSQ
jgi:hypothetical protein